MMDEKDIVLRIDHVAFSYGDAPVLRDVSLEVQRGTCLCLMGVNGCGKSTLLDCVLGEHRLNTGSVRVEGVEASELSPLQLARKVAYVPQVHERSFPYTVEHIVLMGRTAHTHGLGTPDFADEERALQALEACGMAHLAGRPYTSLSGGEMQMVLLARALVQDTEIILMDEPTAHLDFKNELLFLETVERLVVERKVTVLMATHAPNQAFHLANAGVSTQVALMQDGVVRMQGSPREVLSERMLREVFGIEAYLMEAPARREDERPVRQIVPRRTLSADEVERAADDKECAVTGTWSEEESGEHGRGF